MYSRYGLDIRSMFVLEILGPSVDCGKVVQELNWKRMELSTAREEQLLVKEEVEDVQEEFFYLNEHR